MRVSLQRRAQKCMSPAHDVRGNPRHTKITILPQFQMTDQHEVTRGLPRPLQNLRFTTVLDVRWARNDERVARAPGKFKSPQFRPSDKHPESAKLLNLIGPYNSVISSKLVFENIGKLKSTKFDEFSNPSKFTKLKLHQNRTKTAPQRVSLFSSNFEKLASKYMAFLLKTQQIELTLNHKYKKTNITDSCCHNKNFSKTNKC